MLFYTDSQHKVHLTMAPLLDINHWLTVFFLFIFPRVCYFYPFSWLNPSTCYKSLHVLWGYWKQVMREQVFKQLVISTNLQITFHILLKTELPAKTNPIWIYLCYFNISGCFCNFALHFMVFRVSSKKEVEKEKSWINFQLRPQTQSCFVVNMLWGSRLMHKVSA